MPPFTPAYEQALLRHVVEELGRPAFGHVGATADLVQEGGEAMVRLRAGQDTLTWGLAWPVFAYEPDGSDPEEHAALLAIQFDSDAGPGR